MDQRSYATLEGSAKDTWASDAQGLQNALKVSARPTGFWDWTKVDCMQDMYLKCYTIFPS